MSPIGIFGGTFDPIHYGHLRTAFEMLQALRFGEVRFVPSGDPPYRGETYATAPVRLDMVASATRNEPRFIVDDRELRRDGPSYTVDTLASMRAELPDVSMGLILGMDAFLGLTTTIMTMPSPQQMRYSSFMMPRKISVLAPRCSSTWFNTTSTTLSSANGHGNFSRSTIWSGWHSGALSTLT